MLTHRRDKLSQTLPAIPDEQQPTRTRNLVARGKGQGKICSTAQSRQGGLTKKYPSRRLRRDCLTTSPIKTGVFRNVTGT